MMHKCITFAGPGGLGKTPVAVFLSWNLNLPIFSHDAIRTELTEDLGDYSKIDNDYLITRNERIEKLLRSGHSFIYDASMDRRLDVFQESFKKAGYETMIISFNVSKNFYLKALKAKNYSTDKKLIGPWICEHKKFLHDHGKEISLVITDENYKDRMELALAAAIKFIKS